MWSVDLDGYFIAHLLMSRSLVFHYVGSLRLERCKRCLSSTKINIKDGQRRTTSGSSSAKYLNLHVHLLSYKSYKCYRQEFIMTRRVSGPLKFFSSKDKMLESLRLNHLDPTPSKIVREVTTLVYRTGGTKTFSNEI